MACRSSSRKFARIISYIASRIYFLLIIFQIPLFRVACRTGICKSPIEITASQMLASEIMPIKLVKIILYPGAITNALINGENIPNYGEILDIYNFTHVNEAPSLIDLLHLEILAGSYLSVVGALLGLIKPGRLSLFGLLLLLWGILKELIKHKTTYIEPTITLSLHIFPTMFIALFTASLSIKNDVKEIVRSFRAHSKTKSAIEMKEFVKKRKQSREMKRLEWNVNYDNNSCRSTPRSTKAAHGNIHTPCF